MGIAGPTFSMCAYECTNISRQLLILKDKFTHIRKCFKDWSNKEKHQENKATANKGSDLCGSSNSFLDQGARQRCRNGSTPKEGAKHIAESLKENNCLLTFRSIITISK